MALTFPNYHCAYYDNADFMDDATSFSVACWVRLDDIVVGVRQIFWAHYGSTNRIYLRKNNATPELFRMSVTSGGTARTVDDTTGAPVADTWYHLATTWEAGGALTIYRNGVYVTETDCTTQTSTYNSGGAVDFVVGASRVGYDYARSSLEGLCYWKNTVLSANQIAALYQVGWPHLAGCPKPDVFYPMLGSVASRIPDASGNGRHMEDATISASVAADATAGKWDDPDVGMGGQVMQGTAGPPPAAGWTLWDGNADGYTTLHPTTTSIVTGLTNGTVYEFKVLAVDDQARESSDSEIVASTPVASAGATAHTSHDRLLFTR